MNSGPLNSVVSSNNLPQSQKHSQDNLVFLRRHIIRDESELLDAEIAEDEFRRTKRLIAHYERLNTKVPHASDLRGIASRKLQPFVPGVDNRRLSAFYQRGSIGYGIS